MVVPSASKMIKELLVRCPVRKNDRWLALNLLIVIPYSPGGGEPSSYCRTAGCVSQKPPPWTSASPALLACWLLASLWSGRRGLCQGSAHLSHAVAIAVLTRDLG